MKNVSRKISMLLLCAMMLTIVFSYGASAEVEKNEWRDIKWDYDTLIDAVTIHCSGVVPVSKDMPWKDKANNITAFVFDSGVTEIPAGFSDGCVSMDAIKIPATTRSIGEGVLTVGNLTDIWYEGTWESFLQIKMSEKDLAAAKKARFHGSMLLRNEDGSVEYVEVREDNDNENSDQQSTTEIIRGDGYTKRSTVNPDGTRTEIYYYDDGRIEVVEYDANGKETKRYTTTATRAEDGDHTQATYTRDDGTVVTEVFDSSKKLIKRVLKYPDEKVSVIDYEYDDDGDLHQSTETLSDGTVIVRDFHPDADYAYKRTETRTDGTVIVIDIDETNGNYIHIQSTATQPDGTVIVIDFHGDKDWAYKATTTYPDKTVEVIDLNEDTGKFIQKTTTNPDGTKTVEEYADDGETVTRVIEYRDDGTTGKVTEYHTDDGTKSVKEYADNGFTVIKRTDFRDDGTTEKVTECNGIGKEILVTEYAEDGATVTKTTETAYAADDMTPTQTTEKRGNGTVEKVTVYDGQGEEIFSVDYPESEGITEVTISDVDTEHGTIKEITTKTDEGETVHYYNEEGEETTPAGSPVVE